MIQAYMARMSKIPAVRQAFVADEEMAKFNNSKVKKPVQYDF